MTEVVKALGVVRQSLPPVDLALKSALRLTIALSVILASYTIPGVIADELRFVGKFYIMWSVIGVIGHSEGKVMGHISSWVTSRIVKAKASRADWRAEQEQLAHCRKCGGCGSCPLEESKQVREADKL